MPVVFHGRIISFAVSDEWVQDPSISPMLSQQFLTYRFIPQAAIRDGILYGTLQIREVLNPLEKTTLLSQLQMLTNPMMAAAILVNLGVQPQSVAGNVQQIQIHDKPCIYRIIDGMAMMTAQPVRCYIGIIDMGMYAIEIIAITVLWAWPALLPQILEIFTSITPAELGMISQSIQRSPVFVNQDASGKISYKLQQQDGRLQVFDELKIPEHATVNINIDGRTLNIGKDVEIKGQINFGDNSKLEGFTMSNDQINIHDVVGPVNVKSRLDRVSQTVNNAPSIEKKSREELSKLFQELRDVLEPVAKAKPQDGERVIQSAEMVVNEVTKEKPSKSFLDITLAGLTEAAKAVEAIAPSVLTVATKIASFVATLV